MKAKKYTAINKSTTSGKDSFIKNLISYYKENPVITSLTNGQDNSFIFFNKGIDYLEKEFNKLINEALNWREVDMNDYMQSGYITSEINSSLKAEGVHSSRKIVDQVLKHKKTGEKISGDEITKLISNYYEGISFILGNKEITERNIFTLYGIITADLSNIIEEGALYRKGDVSVGEDVGLNPNIISKKMKELVRFINSEELEDRIQTKAIIAHYIFENIHPYYDYNGRIGRIIHLWILINKSPKEFWKLVFLSEAIYTYKEKLDTTFRRITKAKKNKANIDLTYFISNLYEIFNTHTQSYLKMKKLTSSIKNKKPSRHLRLFIIDLLCINGANGKWYTMQEFKRRYNDYSPTTYDRLLKEIRESGIFEIRLGKPIEFRLKTFKQKK